MTGPGTTLGGCPPRPVTRGPAEGPRPPLAGRSSGEGGEGGWVWRRRSKGREGSQAQRAESGGRCGKARPAAAGQGRGCSPEDHPQTPPEAGSRRDTGGPPTRAPELGNSSFHQVLSDGTAPSRGRTSTRSGEACSPSPSLKAPVPPVPGPGGGAPGASRGPVHGHA